MAQGGKRAGAGRPPGAQNKRSVELAREAEASGLMPLEYMLSVLRDVNQTNDNRMWAAEKAAPYVHAKLSAVEMSGSLTVNHEDALEELE